MISSFLIILINVIKKSGEDFVKIFIEACKCFLFNRTPMF